MKTKRPSLQFYPSDWMTDLALRRCSPAARGVWMDVLCALHNSDDQYGVLRWPLKDIASTIGAAMVHVKELADKGVLKGSDKAITQALVYVPRHGRKDGEPVTLIAEQPGPLWYSKRLVKDEYIRTIRGESTRFGADEGATPKHPPKTAPKPPFGDGSSSSSSSSSSSFQDLTTARSDTASPAEMEAKARALGYLPEHEDDPEPGEVHKLATPAGRMATELRRLGVITSSLDETLQQWVQDGITTEFAVSATQLVRNSTKPYPEPIPSKYLDKKLRDMQRKASAATPAPIKYRTADEIEAEERARGDAHAQH